MAKLLARMHIRQVQLDGRHLGGADGVHQRQRGVGVGAGIEDDAVLGTAGGVDRIDQRAFVVALREIKRHAERFGMGAAHRLDVGDGGAAIDLGLAQAEQVEVGAIEDEQRMHWKVSRSFPTR